MIWSLSYRFDADCLPLADRHYNRQRIGSPQFVPPGRCVVLKAAGAIWVTSWPRYVQHAWPGAWVNTLFRRETGGHLASDMIREAIAATRAIWDPPDEGLVTFIDPSKVRPMMRRGHPTWGYSYLKAGFTRVGTTRRRGFLVFRLQPADMPAPSPPLGYTPALFDLRAVDSGVEAVVG